MSSQYRIDEPHLPDPFSLIMGEAAVEKRTPGFSAAASGFAAKFARDFLLYSGEGHLCTVAPTRSGKGVSAIVPNLSHYRGTTIVLDPKGENYDITARGRREMGHRVYKLDPFGAIDSTTDSVNPLDALRLPNADVETDAQTLAEAIVRGMTSSREPFWDHSGIGLLSAMLMVAATREEPNRNLGWAFDMLSSDDVVYNLAVLLDTQKETMPAQAYREIASFLQITDLTRSGILAVTQSYFKMLATTKVRRTIDTSTIDLADVIDGNPVTIYMILPSERINSHAGLLKVWLATFFKAVLARKSQPTHKTLFLLDEAGQLGGFPFLESLMTLAGGYGVWLWLIYQDLSQLQAAYPKTWKTMLNNCGVLQFFGVNNRQMATSWAECLDSSAAQILKLANDEQMLLLQKQGEVRCRRINYLHHPYFAGKCDPNRLFRNHRPGGPSMQP